MAEIDADTEESRQFLVVGEEKIIVCGHRTEFGEAPPHPQERPVHGSDRDRTNRLDEGHARLAVADGEEDTPSTPSREDEVGFRIADPAPRIDILRSLVDEGAVRKMLRTGSSCPSALSPSHTMALDPSSVRTVDVSIHGILGQRRHASFMTANAHRHRLGRLVIHEP